MSSRSQQFNPQSIGRDNEFLLLHGEHSRTLSQKIVDLSNVKREKEKIDINRAQLGNATCICPSTIFLRPSGCSSGKPPETARRDREQRTLRSRRHSSPNLLGTSTRQPRVPTWEPKGSLQEPDSPIFLSNNWPVWAS